MDSIFGIGLPELFFIAVIALVVLGPERLPGTLRELAKYWGYLRNLSRELTSQFSEEFKALEELNPRKLLNELADEELAKDLNLKTTKPAKPATTTTAAKSTTPKPATTANKTTTAKPVTAAKPAAKPATTTPAKAAEKPTEQASASAEPTAEAPAPAESTNSILPPQEKVAAEPVEAAPPQEPVMAAAGEAIVETVPLANATVNTTVNLNGASDSVEKLA